MNDKGLVVLFHFRFQNIDNLLMSHSIILLLHNYIYIYIPICNMGNGHKSFCKDLLT